MKATLSNTTVRYTKKRDNFRVFKGKGAGSQIAGFRTMDEAIRFNEELPKLEYKLIKSTGGKKGGAWFYRGTSRMFDKNHPFGKKFTII